MLILKYVYSYKMKFFLFFIWKIEFLLRNILTFAHN